jgi:hypothetical protein
MRPTVLFTVVALACSHEPPRSGQPTDNATTARTSALDSLAVRVDGPTLIAFYPTVTQAQVDSSADLATVLEEFSLYLSTAQDSLRALGFVIIERPPGPFRVIDRTGSRHINLRPDSADVGYVFVAPGRPHRVFYGVVTNPELIAAGRTFLATGQDQRLDRRPNER